MKKLKLPDHWITYLEKQPETGMGYQVCTLTLKNGAILPNVTISGCEYIASAGGVIKHLNVDDIVNIKVES